MDYTLPTGYRCTRVACYMDAAVWAWGSVTGINFAWWVPGTGLLLIAGGLAGDQVIRFLEYRRIRRDKGALILADLRAFRILLWAQVYRFAEFDRVTSHRHPDAKEGDRTQPLILGGCFAKKRLLNFSLTAPPLDLPLLRERYTKASLDPAPLHAIEEAYAILKSRWSAFNEEFQIPDIPEHLRVVVEGPAFSLHEALTAAEAALPDGTAITL